MDAVSCARTSQWPAGLAAGVLVGLVVWAGYFVQASVFDGLYWDRLVLPILGTLGVGALVIAARARRYRRWWWGFAAGAVLMVPLALFAFLLLFAMLGLE